MLNLVFIISGSWLESDRVGNHMNAEKLGLMKGKPRKTGENEPDG